MNNEMKPQSKLARDYQSAKQESQARFLRYREGAANDGVASTIVSNALMEQFGISQEQLNADAVENSPKIFPARIESMANMMRRIMAEDMQSQGIPQDQVDAMLDSMIPADDSNPMTVVTNDRTVNGAAVMFYPEQMEQIGDMMHGDFFILPSSVHEMLIIPDTGDFHHEELKAMVTEINATQVAPADRLTDEVYHFDTKDKVFEKPRKLLQVVGHTPMDEITREPEFGIVLSEKNGFKTYISPFSFANWINDIVVFFNVRYLAERKYSYSKMIKNNMNALKGLRNEVVKRKENVKDRYSYAPDKAILFSYVSFGQSEDGDSRNDKYSLAYHLTNGYKDSYHYSNEITHEIKSPIDDVYWYATQEGAAYLAWLSDDNKEVFESLIPSKVRTDYFALYMKILCQSFSLLLYAEKIQTNISAVNEKYIAEPLDKRITDLFGEINLFLTKSMATSVSHIHHQSEFYVYIKNQLRVQDDVESVTAGLNALDAIQREQRQREENKRIQEAWQEEQRRDREAQEARLAREAREKKSDGKIQAIMGLFALLGISSALVDCFDFISKFDPAGDFWSVISVTQGIEIGFFVVVEIISLIAIYFL